MIFETIFFLIFSILIITSFIGYGQIINTQNHTSDIDNFFFGLIIIAFLVTIIHFFIRINLFVSLIIIFIGIFLYFKNS